MKHGDWYEMIIPCPHWGQSLLTCNMKSPSSQKMFHLFPTFTAIDKESFCLTHGKIIGCNALQICSFTLSYTRQKTPIKIETLPLLWTNHSSQSQCGFAISKIKFLGSLSLQFLELTLYIVFIIKVNIIVPTPPPTPTKNLKKLKVDGFLNSFFLPASPLLLGQETCDQQNDRQILIQVVVNFVMICRACVNILSIVKVKIIMQVIWSYRSPQLCWLLSLEWSSYFEHAIQSLLNTYLFGIHSWNHAKPHTTQIQMSL